jgi:curved DNA-binding protein CbpA
MDYHECCGILDLVPPVTLEDAKQAYKELVQVWHPDRFTHSPKLQVRAENKIKQLNLAYETLEPLLRNQQEARIRETARKAQEASNPPENATPDPSVWDMASAYHDAMNAKKGKTRFDRVSLKTKATIAGILMFPTTFLLIILFLWFSSLLATYPQIIIITLSLGGLYYGLRKLSEYSSR